MSHINEAPLNFDANATFSANATFRVDFAVPIGNAPTNKGIGKGDKMAGDVGSKNDQYAGLSDSNLDPTRTEVLKDLNLITRSVASSQVSQALGLNSVVAEAYAKAPDGRNIGVSAMASGSQLMTNAVDANGRPEAIVTRDFDFKRPEIQKGLYDLEAVDYLTGQIDRHSGNIFINNETGQVEGIDNDLCFGDKPISLATRDPGVGGKTVGAPPLFYHEDTAAAIEKMTPEDLTEMLKGVTAPDGTCGLSDAEIAAAVGRLETMQADIKLARSEGRVVAQFDDNTFEASLKHNQAKSGEAYNGTYKATGNYVGRSHQELEYAKQQSQQPDPFDRIDPPGPARPLTPYEQGLAEQKAAVKQAEAVVLADPGDDLKQALVQKQNLENEIAVLDAEINAALENKSSLNSNLALNEQAQAALTTNVAALKACQNSKDNDPDSPEITAEQAKLINNMVPGIEPVQAGQRLNPRQQDKVAVVAKDLSDRQLADMRAKEVEAKTSFVQSAAPEAQMQRKEALSQLAAVEKNVQALVQADPRVQQAMAAEQNFINAGKPVLIQERDDKVIAQAAEAQLQSDLKFAGEIQKQEDLLSLAESVAESNNLPVESLNLTRGGKLQTPAQLRSSAINSRDDAGASKLAGDQMAGTVDHDNLSEGEALAMEGTLSQLGGGSDLEVAKMYARADELNAIADVQVKFGEIAKAMDEGKEPTQEQLESFGAAVQVLSECTQKSQAATQAVNDSIKARLQEKLEAKVGPLLDEKGYSPEEKAAAIDALADAAMDIDIMKLRDTDERADLYVDQMAEGIAQSDFDYPGGNKVHEAVYRAFDAVAVDVPDGSIAVKPAGGGQTFNEKRANEHINKALEKQGMPVPELPQGPARAQALAPQVEAGKERMDIYNSKVALEARKTEEIKSLKAHISELEGKKEHLENHASKAEKFKAFLKNGPKGTSAEVAKIDKEIAAAKKALDVVQSGIGVDQQKADLHQKKGELQAGKQQLDQVNKNIKGAEKIIKSAELKGDLDSAMLSPMSDKQRDALVRQANAAINVREALKPQAQQLKEANKDLKAEVKMGEKAVSVRDKVGPKPGQAAIGGHRGGGHAV